MEAVVSHIINGSLLVDWRVSGLMYYELLNLNPTQPRIVSPHNGLDLFTSSQGIITVNNLGVYPLKANIQYISDYLDNGGIFIQKSSFK